MQITEGMCSCMPDIIRPPWSISTGNMNCFLTMTHLNSGCQKFCVWNSRRLLFRIYISSKACSCIFCILFKASFHIFIHFRSPRRPCLLLFPKIWCMMILKMNTKKYTWWTSSNTLFLHSFYYASKVRTYCSCQKSKIPFYCKIIDLPVYSIQILLWPLKSTWKDFQKFTFQNYTVFIVNEMQFDRFASGNEFQFFCLLSRHQEQKTFFCMLRSRLLTVYKSPLQTGFGGASDTYHRLCKLPTDNLEDCTMWQMNDWEPDFNMFSPFQKVSPREQSHLYSQDAKSLFARRIRGEFGACTKWTGFWIFKSILPLHFIKSLLSTSRTSTLAGLP